MLGVESRAGACYITHSFSAASFFSPPSSSSHLPSSSTNHTVASLGRLLFIASRAAFQLAPNLILVLPVLLSSLLPPESAFFSIRSTPSAHLAQVTSAKPLSSSLSFAPLLRSALSLFSRSPLACRFALVVYRRAMALRTPHASLPSLAAVLYSRKAALPLQALLDLGRLSLTHLPRAVYENLGLSDQSLHPDPTPFAKRPGDAFSEAGLWQPDCRDCIQNRRVFALS